MRGIGIAMSGMIVLMSSLAYGQSDTQAIDQQDSNHGQWIERSFDRGQLDRPEEVQPDRKTDRVDRPESRAKADGAVTKKKAARVGPKQNRASRPIVREQHARQGASHR
ncbi:MAG: hypothetical protein U0236_18710 [Nitrospira sp.]